MLVHLCLALVTGAAQFKRSLGFFIRLSNEASWVLMFIVPMQTQTSRFRSVRWGSVHVLGILGFRFGLQDVGSFFGLRTHFRFLQSFLYQYSQMQN